MNIQNEPFSELIDKHQRINIELSRLTALMLYYNDSGNDAKKTATIDASKRLEMNKSAIAIEIDKRMKNGFSSNDEVRPSS